MQNSCVMKNILLPVIMSTASLLVMVSCHKQNVQELNQVIVAVESLELDPTYATVDAGDVLVLKAIVKPEDATFKTVSWKSSDPSLAEVYNGTVKTLKEGSVTITATVSGMSATCNITINKLPVVVNSITLNKTETTLAVGETETLIASVNPKDADDPTVTWTSSNWAVASVVEGVVTAIAEGTAVITAKAGDQTATCTVTVPHVYIPLESLEFAKTETTLRVGGTEKLELVITPYNADHEDIVWTSTDEGVATVTDGLVKAVGVGTAVITARSGDKSAQCTVSVLPVSKPVESVQLNKHAFTLEVGGSEILVATVSPVDTDDTALTWTSSDERIATVSPNGRVVAVAEGIAVITVKAGDKTDTCTVTVIPSDKTDSGTIDDLGGEDKYPE